MTVKSVIVCCQGVGNEAVAGSVWRTSRAVNLLCLVLAWWTRGTVHWSRGQHLTLYFGCRLDSAHSTWEHLLPLSGHSWSGFPLMQFLRGSLCFWQPVREIQSEPWLLDQPCPSRVIVNIWAVNQRIDDLSFKQCENMNDLFPKICSHHRMCNTECES